MFNKKLSLSIILASTFISSLLSAADKIYLQQSNHHQIGINTAGLTPSKDAQFFNNALGFTRAMTLEEKRVYKGKNGTRTTRYIQKFQNVPILGEEVIIAENTLREQNVYGSALYGIEDDIQSVKATLSGEKALEIAKSIFEKILKKNNEIIDENKYNSESSELKIWQNKKGTAVLIYDVQFMYEGKSPSMPRYYIDAHTGKILGVFDNLMHANATGPGGNVKMGQYIYGTDFGALDVSINNTTCTMNNADVVTMDLNHGSDANLPLTPFSFTCPENTHKTINGGYSPLNGNPHINPTNQTLSK